MDKFILAPLEVLTDHRLSDPERKVLLALFSFRGKNTNIVYPSAEKIAHRCGFKDKTRVSKITTSLVKKGWLEKTRQGFTNRINYAMIVPELASQTNLDYETNLEPETKPELAYQTKPELAPETNSNKEDILRGHIKNNSLSVNKFTDDDMRCAQYVQELVLQNNPTAKIKLEKFAIDINRLVRIDNRTHKQICDLFKKISLDVRVGFCWSANCRSPAKLRERKDGLQYFDIISNQLSETLRYAQNQQSNTQPSLVERVRANARRVIEEAEGNIFDG